MTHVSLNENDESWMLACSSSDLAPGEAMALPLIPPVAVFNVDGEFFATDDTCTHADSSLADGYIEGEIVECAFHFAKFCIKDGAALSAPAFEPLRTYDVHVSNGDVYVNLSNHQSA